MTGFTESADFPIAGSLQALFGGAQDAFVTKFNAAGSALVYSSYLGGSGVDVGSDIAVDGGGNAYLTGLTQSADFPTAGSLQPTLNGESDSFVTKLNTTGTTLVYSTYLGGSDSDEGLGLAVGASGNAFITGATSSTDFPMASPFQNTLSGDVDAFVTQLNSSGASLVYSTYLGGSGTENLFLSEGPLVGVNIAVDANESAYVTGFTDSPDFPTVNPLQPVLAGGKDTFVAKISGAEKLYFAQFGNGGGFTSDLVLTNPSSGGTASGQVDFFDDNGFPLSIGIASVGGEEAQPLGTGISPLDDLSTVTFSIPPLGVTTISTDGQGEVEAGAAVVTSDQTLGGLVRFTIPGIGTAEVAASQPLVAFIVPVRRQAGGINTGLAIHNTESAAVTMDLTLRDIQGQLVNNGTETITNFPGRGHLAQFIDSLFPNAATDDFEGTLVVEVTGGSVAATALELGTEPGQFTTLPVTPLN